MSRSHLELPHSLPLLASALTKRHFHTMTATVQTERRAIQRTVERNNTANKKQPLHSAHDIGTISCIVLPLDYVFPCLQQLIHSHGVHFVSGDSYISTFLEMFRAHRWTTYITYITNSLWVPEDNYRNRSQKLTDCEN